MIEDILIEPVDKELDVPTIERYLDTLPNTARDRTSPTMFMVASSPSSLRDAVKKRAADPTSFPTNLILIDVRKERIDLSYRSADVAPARQFVKWLRHRMPVRIMDETFRDVTAECDPNLNYLFGEP